MPDGGNGSLDELRAALRADADKVARALLGEPTFSKPKILRWGAKGSFKVDLAGGRRGLWHSKESGEGGDLLALIRQERRCSFADAVAWARDMTGLPEKQPASEADRQRRAQQDADRRTRQAEAEARSKAEAEAERAGSIAWVQKIARECVSANGTTGDLYLAKVRRIPHPVGGWPDCVRWHHRYHALVMVATRADGVVQRIQRIHLDAAGGKISADEMERRKLPAVKVTNGPADGAVVRLPGDPSGPLMIAEGPETGLACWSATRHECWIALGSVGAVELPPCRQIVVIADDNPSAYDERHGAAARALSKAVAAWRQAGVDLRLATPWEAKRYDRSDFADLILVRCVEAVRDRINAVLAAPPVLDTPRRLRPYYDAPTEPRDVALARQRALIRDTIQVGAVSGGARRRISKLRDEAFAADPDFDQRSPAEKAAVTRRIKRVVLAELNLTRLPPPSHILVTGAQGSGKTRTTLEAVAQIEVDLVVRFTQPSHEKAAEVLADYEAVATATSLPAMLIRGRGSFDPLSAKEERMRLRHDVTNRAARKGVNVRKAICTTCPFQPVCGYIRQEDQIRAMGGAGRIYCSAGLQLSAVSRPRCRHTYCR